jgi:hypothetical protein
MSRNLRRSQRSRNCAEQLSLLDWQPSRPTCSRRSRAVLHIQHRAGCSPSTAAVYAGILGYPVEEVV